MNNIKIGADPELFFEKDNEIISVEGMIGGSKENPLSISNEGHAIQEDNVMAEFNIPPCEDRDAFLYHMNFVKEHLGTLAGLFGCKLNFSASSKLDRKYLQTEQAKTFGCDPDWNIYLLDNNVPPDSKGDLRCCGGHIHVGYDNPSEEQTMNIVYAMDMLLGLESLKLDKDNKRRTMYGKAGSFRFKNYGLEYRTLSNFWIANDELILWAFDKTQEAIELANSANFDNLVEKYSKLVEKAINTNDLELAEKLTTKIKEENKVKTVI